MIGYDGSFVDIVKGLFWLVWVLLLICGGVIVGLFLVWVKCILVGNGGDYMEVVVIGDGVILVCNMFLCSIFLLVLIVLGGFIGCEGLMV